MTLSNTAILSAVELPIYLIILPVVIYLTFRHGRHGCLGYLYLNISCGVRVAADIVEIIQGSQRGDDSTQPTLAAVIIGSIGLSPLLLALAGFVHELHYHLLFATNTPSKASKINRWLWIAQCQVHTVTVVGMVLLIIGGIHIATAKPTSDISSDEKLRYGGAILLLLVWLGLVQYSGWLLYRCYQCRTNLRPSALELGKWILLAGLIIGIRVIYAVVYTFDHSDTAISPITGSFAVKVVLTVAVTLAAVSAMTFAGWRSRNIARHRPSAHGREVEESGYLMTQKVEPVAQ